MPEIFTRNFFSRLDKKLQHLSVAPNISQSASIHPSAIISGPVFVSSGVTIGEYVVINGPCFLGDNVSVGSFCKLRPGTVLEPNVRLGTHVEVKHSLIGSGSHFHSGYIGDSIIGKNCRVGAGFITANRRLDRRNIRVILKGKLHETGSSYFGCLMGDRVRIGIHCGTNPGVVIPDDSVILPMTLISGK